MFVTGEAGIGKTTLVEAFAAEVGRGLAGLVARGQCLEQRGAPEPYLPIFDTFGRLCRGQREAVLLLSRAAPTWLAQMPALVEPADRADLERRALGGTRERMLRETAEALEAAAAGTGPRAPARRARPRAVAAVLGRGSPGPTSPRSWPSSCTGEPTGSRCSSSSSPRSGPTPASCDRRPAAGSWCRARGADPEVPEDLRRLLELQLGRLDAADLAMLEAAAVAGVEFAAATAASDGPATVDAVEGRCAALARQGRFLSASGPVAWPDGTVSAGFRFAHDLTGRCCTTASRPAGRRARLHAAVADRLERAHGPAAADRAAELATHFLEGQDHPRAVGYLQAAAIQALARSAPREAIQHLETLLEAVTRLPAGAQRDQAELVARMSLGPALIATRGFASPEVEAAYTRARELCVALGRPGELALVLHGLAAVNELRGRYHVSDALLQQTLQLGVAELAVEVHELLACSTSHQGAAARAVGYAERGWPCTTRTATTATWRPTGSIPPSPVTTGRRWRCGSWAARTAPWLMPSGRGPWPRPICTAWPAPRCSSPTCTSTGARCGRRWGGRSGPWPPRASTASRSGPSRRPSSAAGRGPRPAPPATASASSEPGWPPTWRPARSWTTPTTSGCWATPWARRPARRRGWRRSDDAAGAYGRAMEIAAGHGARSPDLQAAETLLRDA